MLVKILNEELTNQIKEIFTTQSMHPVELLYFSSKITCETCDETGQLLEEIVALSDKLHLNLYDLDVDHVVAQKYNAHLAPSIVIAGGGSEGPIDYGIRFSGIPSGYEFGSLIQAIILVSNRDSGLKPAIRNELGELKKQVHLQVFVTPT